MALPNLERRALPAVLLTIVLFAALGPGWPGAASAASPSAEVGNLMDRLFFLVKRSYAEIATLDAQLKNPRNRESRDELAADLVEKVALFQDRNRKVLAKLPEVQAEQPAMSATLANYLRELSDMEAHVGAMAKTHGLETRVADLRRAAAAEEQARLEAQAAAADEDDAGLTWEPGRKGAPLVEPATQAPTHEEVSETEQMPRPRRIGSSHVRQTPADRGVEAGPADDTGDQPPSHGATRPARRASAGEASNDAPDTSEAVAAILARIRHPHGPEVRKEVSVAVQPAPARLQDSLAAPPNKRARGATPEPASRIVPVALEVRDDAGKPVARRPVEFVVETAAGLRACLVDRTSRVQSDSLVDLTDEAGVARVDMRIDGDPATRIRVERTVIPQADRTICRMHVGAL